MERRGEAAHRGGSVAARSFGVVGSPGSRPQCEPAVQVAAAGAGGCVRAVAGRRAFVRADPAGDGGVAFVARGSGSVEDNIRAVLEVVAKSRSHRESILDALLEEFAIGHLRDTLAVALSGGERRRVEIARALACNPQFIFLDEPFAGIDPIALSDIRDLVVHLKDRGIGVLITDHNVRETLDVIDRAYIYDGRVLME